MLLRYNMKLPYQELYYIWDFSFTFVFVVFSHFWRHMFCICFNSVCPPINIFLTKMQFLNIEAGLWRCTKPAYKCTAWTPDQPQGRSVQGAHSCAISASLGIMEWKTAQIKLDLKQKHLSNRIRLDRSVITDILSISPRTALRSLEGLARFSPQ